MHNIAMMHRDESMGIRVSRELCDRLSKHAEHLDIPVAVLIRNILEEAAGMSPNTGIAPASSKRLTANLPSVWVRGEAYPKRAVRYCLKSA